jgi:hypothetical protein
MIHKVNMEVEETDDGGKGSNIQIQLIEMRS